MVSPDQEDEGGVAVYATVRDEVEEISQFFTGSEDLSSEVQFAHRVNPVYNTRMASETQTLLRNSNVTFKSLNQSFKKNRIRWLDENAPPPSPPPAPPTKEKQNPLQVLVKAVGRKFSSPFESESTTGERGRDSERGPSPEQTALMKPGKKLPLLPPMSKAKGNYRTVELVNSEPGPGTRSERPAVARGLNKSTDLTSATDSTGQDELAPSSLAAKPLSRPQRTGITKLGVVKMDEPTSSGVYGQANGIRKPRVHPPLPSLPPLIPPNNDYTAPHQDGDVIEVEDYSEVFGKIKWTPPHSPTDTRDESTARLQGTITHDYEVIDMKGDEATAVKPPLPPGRIHRSRIFSDSVVYQDPSRSDALGSPGQRDAVTEKAGRKAPRRKFVPAPPKPPRICRKIKDSEDSDGTKQLPRLMKPGEILKVRKHWYFSELVGLR